MTSKVNDHKHNIFGIGFNLGHYGQSIKEINLYAEYCVRQQIEAGVSVKHDDACATQSRLSLLSSGLVYSIDRFFHSYVQESIVLSPQRFLISLPYVFDVSFLNCLSKLLLLHPKKISFQITPFCFSIWDLQYWHIQCSSRSHYRLPNRALNHQPQANHQ